MGGPADGRWRWFPRPLFLLHLEREGDLRLVRRLGEGTVKGRLGAMLTIAAGISVFAPAVGGYSVACAQKGAPTARVCALRDFGKPLPTNPRFTADPIWFTNPGFMVLGPEGSLLSTSPAGGVSSGGTAFKMTPKGDLTVLHPFAGSVGDGKAPRSGLVDGKDGWFYGTTEGGGKFKTGTIFRTKGDAGTLQVLFHFRNGNHVGLKPPCDNGRCPFSPRQRADALGSYPVTPPVSDGMGNFYGVTSISGYREGGALYRLSPPYDSTGFSTLCIFDPWLLNDSTLSSYVCHPKLVSAGSLTMRPGSTTLYGTTLGGHGTVFQATTTGSVSVLHEFTGVDGSKPSGLLLASDGRLYGTTATGGPYNNLGTVFRLDPATNAFSVLASFKTASLVVGYGPQSGVIEGKPGGVSDGFLYGTARYGGRFGRGIIFRVGMDGQGFSVLHDFYTTGRFPIPGLVQDGESALTFYGVTYQGGAWNSGTFYRLTHTEYPPRATSPVNIKPTTRTKVVKAGPVEVWTSATADQGGPLTAATSDGLATRITCRDPHFVQFIFREKLDASGRRLPGTLNPSSGQYELTTSLADTLWHSDGAGKPNAYYDEGRKAAYFHYLTGGVTQLTVWDQPNFDEVSVYDPAKQDPRASETWRASFKTYAICNCEVKWEIRWALEKVGGKQVYKSEDISIRPADNSALEWINAQLLQDGFDAVP